MKKASSWLLLALLVSPQAGASDQEDCPTALINKLESPGITRLLERAEGLNRKKTRPRGFLTEWDYLLEGLAAGEVPSPLDRQRERMRAFGQALAEAREGDNQDAIRDLLEALRLVDYPHAAPALMKAFLSGSEQELLESRISELYNEGDGPKRSVFEAYRRAKKYIEADGLKDPLAPFHLDQLLEIQRLAMQDGLAHHELGAVRRQAKGALVTLSRKEYLAVLQNDYLSFDIHKVEETDGVASRIYHGWVNYPEPLTVKEEALKLISTDHPELVQEIREFKDKYKDDYNTASDLPEYGRLIEALCRALSQERIDRFNQYRAKMGMPKTVEQLNDYVRATSLYYRDMISIHLLPDGNGRSLRHFCLYEPLKRVGLPRPRLRNPDADYLLPPGKWLEQIQKGMLSNHFTYLDFADRLLNHLPLASSPELLFPDPPRNIHLMARQHGKSVVERAGQLSTVDPRQFAAFVHLQFEDKAVRRAYAKKPLETMDGLREKFKDFTRKSHLFYTDKSGSRKEIGLIFIDADFRHRFGTKTAHDPRLWRRKLEDSYGTDLVWRGMASLVGSPLSTEQDLLSYFHDFVPHFLSERIKAKSGKKLRRDWVIKEAQKDFDKYNQELLDGSLWQTIFDHVSMGEGYETSSCFSTSKKHKTGELFAMGHLVACDGTEDCRKQAHQKKVAERILVGAARADHNVDANRLKLFETKFSSQYPRQDESLGSGAQDPETIFIVQTLDARAKPIRSWVRNPRNPSEIWVIDGDYRDKLKPWTEWKAP